MCAQAEDRSETASRAGRLASRVASVACATLAACGASTDDPSHASRRPNVLLVSLDTTRRDLLSAYGHRAPRAPGIPTSPHLDRLAAGGVLLEDAYTTTSWTLPSHLSLFSGQPELVHAVELHQLRPDPRHPMLAELLQLHGYRTAGFYSGPYLDPQFGFDRGFDRYVACYDPEAGELRRSAQEPAVSTADDISANDRQASQHDFAHRRGVTSVAVTDAVLSALDEYAGDSRPFFVFAHYFDPHYDFIPPPPFDTRFDPAYDGAMDGRDFFDREDVSVVSDGRTGSRRQVASDRDLEHIRALYAGELAFTDSQIGRVLRRLEERGLADDTLVVVTSDHGEEFFEHGSVGHHRTLFEEVIRAPLLLRLPGTLPAGRRVSGLVSTSDIASTILDVLGLPPAPSLSSSSFLPLIKGLQDASERSALSRIVWLRGFTLTVREPAGSPRPLRGSMITIVETYRQGSIKVTRETRIPQMPALRTLQLPARLAQSVKEQQELRWIDVERFPAEPAEAHSTDFSPPEARAALQAFHDRYALLLSQRRSPGAAEPDAEMLESLRSLGYVEHGVSAVLVAAKKLELAPPGAALLAPAGVEQGGL